MKPSSPQALFESFERVARGKPARPLLLEADARPLLTAEALLDRVAAAAKTMRSEGTASGDLVLIAGLSGAPLLVGILATWACDAAAMQAEAGATPAEIETLHDDFGPRIILSPGPAGEVTAAAASPAAGRDAGPSPHEGAAYVKLTSGSTGRPRGIAVTTGQLLADARHLIEGMAITPDLVNIGAIPLSHSYGLANLVLPLVVQGSRLLIVPAAAGHPLARALSIEEPAFFPGVPVLYDMLGRPDGPPIERRGLRTCISAGALLRPRTAEAFADRVGVPIRAFYGSSETGGICFDASPGGDAAMTLEGCVGAPLPGVTVTLEDDGGRVVVSGDAVAAGYVGPGAPLRAGAGCFHEGAFRTGDTGRFTMVGTQRSLCLTGRVGGLVNVSGRKVNPLEVERVLATMAGVRDAAVLGVPDESRGEALVACIVADAAVGRNRVMAHLRENLAAHKIPRRIVFMDALARTGRGKLDMEALRRAVSGAGNDFSRADRDGR